MELDYKSLWNLNPPPPIWPTVFILYFSHICMLVVLCNYTKNQPSDYLFFQFFFSTCREYMPSGTTFSFSLSLCGIIKNHLIHISIVILLLFRRKKTGHSSIFSSPAVVDGKWVYELCFTFILLLFLNFDFRMLCIIGYHILPRGTRLTTPKIVVKI